MQHSTPHIQKGPRSAGRSGAVQAAAYIVGCLIASAVLDIDLDQAETQEQLLEAINITANCIEGLGLWQPNTTMPQDPYNHIRNVQASENGGKR